MTFWKHESLKIKFMWQSTFLLSIFRLMEVVAHTLIPVYENPYAINWV
jgi:hypothetical protein